MMNLSVLFFVAFAFVRLSQGLNILGVFVYPDFNHWTVYNELISELSKRGNNITVITNFPTAEATNNYREIHIKPFFNPEMEVAEKLNLKNISDMFHLDSRKIIDVRLEMGLSATEHCLKAKDVKEFLTRIKSETPPFDVMLVGDYYQEALLYLSEVIGCPVVGLNPSLPHPSSYYFTGLGSLNIYTFHDLLDPRTETAQDSALALYSNKKYLETYLPKQESLIRDSFNLDPDVSVDFPNMYKRVVYTLSNYYNFFYPASIMGGNYIPVGGFYIGPPKELPTDIKNFLHDANYGAIFVTLPSKVYGLDLDMEILNRFMVSFSSVKQKVLVQWDGPKIVDQPKNVFIRRWIPMGSILAHPYVQLLICTGDIYCVQNSIQRSVPMIAVPITKEQDKSTQMAENAEFGRRLALAEITAENVTKLVQEVFGNQQYIEKVHKAASLYRDRPLGAMEEAVYWVAFAAKHKTDRRIYRDTTQGFDVIPPYYTKIISLVGLISVAVVFLCFGGVIFYKVYLNGPAKRDKKAV